METFKPSITEIQSFNDLEIILNEGETFLRETFKKINSQNDNINRNIYLNYYLFRRYIINLYDSLENYIIKKSNKNSLNIRNSVLDLGNLYTTKPYPNYILEKLKDESLISELIEEGYRTDFDFLNLKEIHQNYFKNNPETLDLFKKSKVRQIQISDFGNKNEPEFWVIEYQQLLFVFNGKRIFPVHFFIFLPEKHYWNLKILYIPNQDIIISTSEFINQFFIRNEVIEKLPEGNIKNDFLKRYTYLFKNINKNYNYVRLGRKITFDDKVQLYYEKNEFDFVVTVFLIYKGKVDFDINNTLQLLFNTGKLEFQNIIKITQTSTKILTQDEIVELLKQKVNSKEDFLELFNIKFILDYLNKGGTFNSKSFISQVYNLDLDFYYFNSRKSYENFFKDSTFERKSKLKLSKFKTSYYQNIREKLRELENQIRLEKGYNLVGTFTNETILFQNLKSYFKDYSVVSQGSPIWLGLQRIDIYFPEFNIGVEYHGEQHFVPVDYFGGEEGLKKNIERDKRKLELCLMNDCKLFVVDKNYEFKKLCKQIEKEIEVRK